jgi:hypothetical protein
MFTIMLTLAMMVTVSLRPMQMHERRMVGAVLRGPHGSCGYFAEGSSPVARASGESSLIFSKWSRPLLTESAPKVEFVLTYRKRRTEKFLTEARTHISDFSIFSFPPHSPLRETSLELRSTERARMNFEEDFPRIIFLH